MVVRSSNVQVNVKDEYSDGIEGAKERETDLDLWYQTD